MSLLLDTHVALWAVSGDPKLSDAARERIGRTDEVAVSAVSIWEIAIKHALRRGRNDDIVVSGHEAIELFEAAGYTLLAVTASHAAAVNDLPPLHGDPFDRLILAQALTEPMHLLTRDARLVDYSPLVLRV